MAQIKWCFEAILRELTAGKTEFIIPKAGITKT
jgi:hypothetical protein